jgi:methenyltetrahydrofolate cyclohydrolase
MPRPADRPLAELLDEVARAQPAPGGGSVAGWGCALGAALVEMAGAFAAEDEQMETVRDRAAALRAEALELAEADLTAYEAVLAAVRLPPDEPDREERVDAALAAASEGPLAIARAACEVAVLGAEAARTSNLHLRGDAAAGALLAEAACRAAAHLVELNLAARPDDPRLKSAAELARDAASARLSALAPTSSQRPGV